MNSGNKGWPAGKVRTYQYKLNEWYDVSKPGTYVVNVCAWGGDLESEVKIYATPLIITVK
jgi:hypothetical protein